MDDEEEEEVGLECKREARSGFERLIDGEEYRLPLALYIQILVR
jgi:hypothetical protein